MRAIVPLNSNTLILVRYIVVEVDGPATAVAILIWSLDPRLATYIFYI